MEEIRRRKNSHIECVICLEDYSDDYKITRLPCRHYFHSHCIHRWFLYKNNCPICRRQIQIPTKPPPPPGVAERRSTVPQVTYEDYRRSRWLCIDQLFELIESLFFRDD